MLKEAVTFDWDEPVSDAERDRIINLIAAQIAGRGLQSAAIWMLEIHRPLIPIAGHASIALSPFVATLFSGGAIDMQKYTKLMRDPVNIDLLIRQIERKSEDLAVAARIR
ncbi:MAG TPA: hypothetical protein VGK19_05980 [Capsulimonadaceae bacterium]|jgi:hypothetical protein